MSDWADEETDELLKRSDYNAASNDGLNHAIAAALRAAYVRGINDAGTEMGTGDD